MLFWGAASVLVVPVTGQAWLGLMVIGPPVLEVVVIVVDIVTVALKTPLLPNYGADEWPSCHPSCGKPAEVSKPSCLAEGATARARNIPPTSIPGHEDSSTFWGLQLYSRLRSWVKANRDHFDMVTRLQCFRPRGCRCDSCSVFWFRV